jgi:hypothetical protein
MVDYRTAHSKIVNALGRVVGVGFVLVGAVVGIFGIVRQGWLIPVPGLVVAVLGVLMMLARPYRPKE